MGRIYITELSLKRFLCITTFLEMTPIMIALHKGSLYPPSTLFLRSPVTKDLFIFSQLGRPRPVSNVFKFSKVLL